MAEQKENAAETLTQLLRRYANDGEQPQNERLENLLKYISDEDKLEILSQNLHPGGLTALRNAVTLGQTGTIETLLGSVPEGESQISLITSRNGNGRNAIFCAASGSRPEVMQLLLSYIPEEERSELVAQTGQPTNIYSALREIVTFEKVDMLELVLATIPDKVSEVLTHRYGSGNSTLLVAASKKADSSTACTLLRNYPDDSKYDALTQLDESGKAPIHWLAENSKKGFEKQCLTPVDISDLVAVRNSSGQTSLHLAAVNSNQMFLTKLLYGVRESRQCDVQKERDSQGRTLVHYGAGMLSELRTIVNLVPVEQRFDLLSASDNDGQTAFHEAAKRNRVDHLELIVNDRTPEQKLYLLDARNSSNETAENVAENNDCQEALNFLRQKKEEAEAGLVDHNEVHIEVQERLPEATRRTTIDNEDIENDIEGLTSQQEKDEQRLRITQQRQRVTDHELTRVNLRLEILSNNLNSPEYRELCHDRERLSRQKREDTHAEQALTEKIRLTQEKVNVLKTRLVQVETVVRDLEESKQEHTTSIRENKQRMWGKRAEEKKARKRLGEDIHTVEEELEILLSDYVKLRGLINIPDERIEEIVYTITQGTKYEIINNAPRIARYDSNLRTIERIRRYLNDDDWVSLLADKNADGCTVMHLAAAYGHNDLIRFIKSKTDSQSVIRLLKEADKNGLLPIFRSLNESTANYLLDPMTGNEIVEILAYDPSNQEPAFHTWTKAQCSDQPNPEIIHAVARSVSSAEWMQLNAIRSENGYTALHWTAVSKRVELARLIAEETKKKEPEKYSCTNMLCLLRQLDKRGSTALMKATDNAVIFAILENLEKELLKQQEANNLTPLHLAACLGSIQTVEFLSEYLQVNSVSAFEVLSCVDGANKTVIHCLAKQGKTDVANQLLSKVSWRQKYQLLAIRNKEGKTADQLTGKKSGFEQK
ncbi:protein lava lamp-like [Watersipora subatra]|uniref:protein lava lamp-like n=1 Tax=Watersipora subatra TaxID=2589382 RepID=UPI00355BF735